MRKKISTLKSFIKETWDFYGTDIKFAAILIATGIVLGLLISR